MKRVGTTITSVLGANWFFYAVLGFLVFQALWFVFTSMYPMAFDEDFHLGIIKIYADQWSPFLAGQPEGTDVFGAVARDPSYLFHYLMSFPYRFVELFTDSQTIQVILLRLLNVGMFAGSLLLFRRVLFRAGTSRALAHTALAIFVLIPIVPQLAAHINYDNLLMLLLAWMILAAFNVIESFRARQVDTRSLLLLLALSMFISIVKYPTLPLTAAIILFTAFMAYRYLGVGKQFWSGLKVGFGQIGTAAKLLLLVGLFIGLGLFVQRYGGNMVAYQTPVPDCGDVLTTEQCMEYGPWRRNYKLNQDLDPSFTANPLRFTVEWLNGLHHRLFFAVNGAHARFANYLQLPVPGKTAIVIATAGTIAAVVWWRKVFKDRLFLVFFATMIILYAGVLWADLFAQYSKTGEAVAINGRYLIPILLPLAAIWGRAIAIGLKQFKWSHLKPYLAAAAIALFLYGGGVITYILRSDATWYWPNQAAVEVNEAAQDVLSPIIIEGHKTNYKD